MAQRFEMKTVPATTTKVCVENTCDICKRKADAPSSYEPNWDTKTTYDISQVTVAARDGARYPEGSQYTVTSFEICPTCFHEKLVPFMKSQGAEPTEKRED